MGEVTKEDFELFQREVKKWQGILGLQSWEIACVLGGTDNENRAECLSYNPSRLATIFVADKWDDRDLNPAETIKSTAFHEVVEILMHQLRTFAQFSMNEELVDKEVHKIIRTLEFALFPKY